MVSLFQTDPTICKLEVSAMQPLVPDTHRRSSAVKEGFHAFQLAARHVINQFLNADANVGFCMCIFTIFKHYFKTWTTPVNHL